MERNNQIFIISILVVICCTAILTLIPIWQLIIIPGIVAGILNSKLRKAVLSGTFGVFIYWLLYIIDGIIFENAYPLFDQFGGLILGTGYGWLIIFLILIFGLVFGLLGAFMGNKVIKVIKIIKERRTLERD